MVPLTEERAATTQLAVHAPRYMGEETLESP
jgi:hypothetical protein